MRNELFGTGRQFNRLFRLGTVAGMTDSQLLEQFVSGNDESAALAFEVIVERHGPMVLRVCRLVLRNVHAAEDAFQATFLVLARKARQLESSDLLGNWLYGVAARTARKAKVVEARRQIRDRQAAPWQTVAVNEQPSRDPSQAELERALHEEIGRLPHSYRAVIVVCYLEGLSQTQAACQLRLAESTVRGRLARARKLLGQRLVRRGIVPSVALAALDNSVDAAWLLGGAMIQVTAQAALSFVNRGQAVPSAISATAQGIASGVLVTMWFNPFKTSVVTVTVLAVLGAWASLVAQRPTTPPVRPAESRVEVSVEPQDENPNRVPAPIKKQDPQVQPAAVNADLAKLVPRPIVRTIPVSKDCMVLAYLPDWNFGNVDNIGIGNNDGGVRTLIDWPAIPPEEATSPERQFLLALYSRKTISHPPASAIHAFEILEEWPERTSWKTKPRYDAEPTAACKFEPGDGWKLFDITPLVSARAKAGLSGHGIMLRFLNEDVPGGPREVFSDYKLVSREGTGQWADRRPVLLVVKGSTPPKSRLIPPEKPPR